MTHSSSRRGSILVRWLATLAILFTFLSSLGVSAQSTSGGASPVPPEATITVDPTTQPIEVTEEPSATGEQPDIPEVTLTPDTAGTPTIPPTEASEFAAATIRSSGFSPPIAFAIPGQIVQLSFSVDMEGITDGGTVTIAAPPLVSLEAPFASPAGDATCVIGMATTSEINVTFSSSGTGGFCAFFMTGLVSVSAMPGSTLTVTATGGTPTEPESIDSSFAITVGTPGIPSLTLALSPDEVFTNGTSTITAILYDPGSPAGSGNLTISFGSPGAELLFGTEQASCSPVCTVQPTWTSQTNSSTMTYTPNPLIPTTYMFRFAVGVPPSTTSGTSVAFSASGTTAGGAAVSAGPVNLSIVEDPSPPMAIGFSPMIVEPGQSVNVSVSFLNSSSSGGTGSIEVNLPTGVTLVSGTSSMYCAPCEATVTEGVGSVSGTFSGSLSTPTNIGLYFTIVVGADVAPGTMLEFTGSGTTQSGAVTDPASSILSIVEPGSAPRMSIAIDNPLPVVGDRITVTVTTNDPSSSLVNPGFVQSYISSYGTYVAGSATISCSPACATTPTVSFSAGQVTGTYISTVDTTTTVITTYQIDFLGLAYPGSQVYFYASGSVANGITIQADPVMATIQESTSVGPLAVMLDDQTAEPGQTIQVSASILEPSIIGTEQGYLQVTAPTGTTIVPGSAGIYCQICPEEPATSSSMVSGHYMGLPGQTNAVTIEFLVTVNNDLTPGTTLTFTGSGTDSFGEAIAASSATATVIALGSEPSASISLSQETAAPGDTVTVTVTFYDPSTSSMTQGGLSVYLPFGVEASSTPGTITCDPACAAPPTFAALPGLIIGNYTPVIPGPTTVTMTFDVVLTTVSNGQTMPFSANGTGADGRFDSSLPVILRVAIPSVPLAISASDMQPAPGDTVTITAMQDEAYPGGPYGFMTISIQPGASLVPGSTAFSGCPSCVESVSDEYPQDVNLFYQNMSGDTGPTGITFDVVIGEDFPSGMPLTIQADGQLANGAPSGPGVVVLTVLEGLTTNELRFDANASQETLGDLNAGVSGGTPPYTFAVVTQPTQGSVVVNADGTFRYVANDDASGFDGFAYSVTDSATTPDSRVSGAAAVTGDVVLVFPGATPDVTPTVEPGETPDADPTTDASGVTKLPNTGQGYDGNSGSNAAMLVALMMAGMVLFGLAATRARRR